MISTSQTLLLICALTAALGRAQIISEGRIVQDFLPFFGNESLRNSIGLMSMDDVYSKLGVNSLCVGNPLFMTKGLAPDNFCVNARTTSLYSNSNEGVVSSSNYFDSFLLESIMLRRWVASTYRPRTNMVVVPSYIYHFIHTIDNIVDTLILACINSKDIDYYWNNIREIYFKPHKNYTPLIVMAYSYNWDSWNFNFLMGLFRQPQEFQARVVIASVEGGNLSDKIKSQYFSNNSDDNKNKKKKQRPTLVTMPHTVHMLQSVSFSTNTKSYIASKVTRPFSILYYGKFNISKRIDPIRTHIIDTASNERHRYGVRMGLKKNFLIANPQYKVDMHNGRKVKSKGSRTSMSKEDLNNMIRNFRLWEMSASSNFCVELFSESPIRKTLYHAILSNCIPVLFDNEKDNKYGSMKEVSYPWRHTTPSLDYHKFCVIYDSNDILRGKINWIQELVDMPLLQPFRFKAYREELAKVASLFQYKWNGKIGQSKSHNEEMDAFVMFQKVLDHIQ